MLSSEQINGKMNNNSVPESVTDISKLHRFLLMKKLKFKIGLGRTRGDGDCFLHGMRQNLLHFAKLGLWQGEIPANADILRKEGIKQLKKDRNKLVNNGPLTEEQFQSLIASQSKKHSFTDEEGYFVRAVCEHLNVELQIVVTSIDSEVIPSGLGGPLQRINVGDGDKFKFALGLIRDEERRTGHYQFIVAAESGEPAQLVPPDILFPPEEEQSPGKQITSNFTRNFK